MEGHFAHFEHHQLLSEVLVTADDRYIIVLIYKNVTIRNMDQNLKYAQKMLQGLTFIKIVENAFSLI